ncbi:MAG: hypothetical protein K6F75_09455 [Butyrivibrio sp.]|nr:hypothetical protein [Butyrivibrio sp.]
MLIAILSIWPFRLWSNIKGFTGGGELVEPSEYVNFEYTIVQKFVTQYDRLSSIDLYISEMINGRYISLSVCDENSTELFKTYVDVTPYEIPGYVAVPIELNVEVGKEYYLVVSDCRSKYIVGLEDVPDDSAYVGSLYYNWQEIPGRHLAAVYNYRIPLHKGLSLIAIAIILAVGAAVITAFELYFKKYPEKNTISTVEKTVRIAANPVAAVVFAALMLMVFPFKLFDNRVIDIVFYEIGLLITAEIIFYAINHRSVKHQFGISFWQNIEGKDRVVYILMMFSIAMTIWYACGYMNDLYDIYHLLSQRKIIIWLLVLMLLTFTLRELVTPINLVWVLVSSVIGFVFYRGNALAETEKEYDLHNAALKYIIIIAVLSGLVAIGTIRSIIGKLLEKRHGHQADGGMRLKLGRFGSLIIIFFALIIVFRNTRTWGVILGAVFAALYIRMLFFRGYRDWFKILSGGLMLNFAISLGFSLLHRYFPAYVSGRFAFIFHTVTVTAEYLTFMGAAATVMLVIKIVAFPRRLSLTELFKSAWKEMVFFGFVMSYAIFTVSRTAYVAIIVCMLAVILVVIARNKGQFFRIIGVMLISVLLCFPAAFTLQRMIPTIVADPVFYAIDDADSLVRGGASWDNRNFMCVERFANLFATKILGADLSDYRYPNDEFNYDKDGKPVLDIYGYPIDEAVEEIYSGKGLIAEPIGGFLVANSLTRAELFMLLDDLNGYVDENSRIDVISNGRITIFKSYLKELNLTGHETMGALLPNGEIALHAHNTYIQMAYDSGMITGAIFVLLIITGIVSGIKLYYSREKEEPLTLITFAITVGFAVAGMTEWVFHLGNPLTIALMLSFAGIVFREKKS